MKYPHALELTHELVELIPPTHPPADRQAKPAGPWYRRQFYRLVPQLVVRVESENEVQQVLHSCARHSLPVTFRAAATSLFDQDVTEPVLIQLSNG